jgi:hypothetical protein
MDVGCDEGDSQRICIEFRSNGEMGNNGYSLEILIRKVSNVMRIQDMIHQELSLHQTPK